MRLGPEFKQYTLLGDVVVRDRRRQLCDSALYNVAPAAKIIDVVKVGLVAHFRVFPLMKKFDGFT